MHDEQRPSVGRAARALLRSRAWVLAIAALLGAGVAIGPALSGFASEPTVSAVESSAEGGKFAWSPTSAEIAPGGMVAFQNNTPNVPHDVFWTKEPGGQKPTCTGVPEEGAQGWKGSCKFNTAGEYTCICSVHPYMTGKITVSGGTTTTTTTSSSGAASKTTTSTTTTSTSTHTTAASKSGGGEESPFAGGPGKAVALRSSQRGTAVHGSVKVSKAGAGGRLEVDLLAGGASLAKSKGAHKRSSGVRVGRFVRGSLHAGKTSFSVSLTSKAKSALHRHHHLALTVKIMLTPSGGSAATATRGVALHG